MPRARKRERAINRGWDGNSATSRAFVALLGLYTRGLYNHSLLLDADRDPPTGSRALMPVLQTHGGAVYYETYGRGRPLLLIHAISAGASTWYGSDGAIFQGPSSDCVRCAGRRSIRTYPGMEADT